MLFLLFILSSNSYSQEINKVRALDHFDTTKKSIYFTFTADSFAEGAGTILKVLNRNNIKASFFFTGNFYSNSFNKTFIEKLIKSNQYVGAHSDRHVLYCDWVDRNKTLVTRDSFERDLNDNYSKMKTFGITKEDAHYFMPPYEWYNDTILHWTHEIGLQLVNLTPGTYTNADYTYPEMKEKYRSNAWIWNQLMEYEHLHTLNGRILLIHTGTDPRRKEKFYNRLDELIHVLKNKGYSFKKMNPSGDN